MFKNMFKNQKKTTRLTNEVKLYNPIEGEIISIENVPDPVFSERMLGDGFAIIPTGNKVYAPISGKVKVLFPTLHALAIETQEGLEALIHIGIDTVELKGEGFVANVQVGDVVKHGDLLITFDKGIIESKATSIITPLVITNMDEINSISIEYGLKNEKEQVATIIKK